jgi:hypothetical protein
VILSITSLTEKLAALARRELPEAFQVFRNDGQRQHEREIRFAWQLP